MVWVMIIFGWILEFFRIEFFWVGLNFGILMNGIDGNNDFEFCGNINVVLFVIFGVFLV